MSENKHTMSELYQWQSLPLSVKVSMTKQRIRDWVNYYGEEGVYISFSGGKDSTVLLDIARTMYPNLKAMFVDTGLEYAEIRKFVKIHGNVDIIRPKMAFKQVCEKYGLPLISKEVSECVYGARKYLTSILEEQAHLNERTNERSTLIGSSWKNSQELADILNQRMLDRSGGSNQRLAIMLGWLTKNPKHPVQKDVPSKDRSAFAQTKWKFFLDAPFEISNICCRVMKKEPSHRYSKETGRMPITAQMATESRLRTQKWLANGCNGFDLKSPISNPMAFWTEQDVLLYIKTHHLPIASVYGEVVVDYESQGQLDGQMSIADYMTASEMEEFDLDKPLLTTTGCKRTGCTLCMFGAHLEKGEGRLERLAKTHPKMLKSLDVIQNNGITYREAIDWINEHNGKGKIIRY